MTATDYTLTKAHAEQIADLVHLPLDLRRKLIEKIARNFGPYGIQEMLAQFIGLANSVTANNRSMLEREAIKAGAATAEEAPRINSPTIAGAIQGAMLADGIEADGRCSECAFRLGSPANQSDTAYSAAECVREGEPFWCHVPGRAGVRARKVCAGYRAARKGG